MNNKSTLSERLVSLLGLSHPPIAITFADSVPPDIEGIEADYPPQTEDGRTGAVSAGCVFWVKASEKTFLITI